MIDLHLSEPARRTCVRCTCDRECETRDGTLIHWPHADAPPVVAGWWGDEMESFSMWLYTCRWHRAADTRHRKRTEERRNAQDRQE